MLRIHMSGRSEMVSRLSGRIDKEDIGAPRTLTRAEVRGKRMSWTFLDRKDEALVGQDGATTCLPYVRDRIARESSG